MDVHLVCEVFIDLDRMSSVFNELKLDVLDGEEVFESFSCVLWRQCNEEQRALHGKSKPFLDPESMSLKWPVPKVPQAHVHF